MRFHITLLSLLASGSLLAADGQAAQNQVGRYQLVNGLLSVGETKGSQTNVIEFHRLWKIDTVTGKVWLYIERMKDGKMQEFWSELPDSLNLTK